MTRKELLEQAKAAGIRGRHRLSKSQLLDMLQPPVDVTGAKGDIQVHLEELIARAPRLRVISLGAGVQSTVMALKAAEGEFGFVPDCAIFADTQWEPAAVYEHLDWLEKQLPFPVYRVTAGSVREAALAKTNEKFKGRFASVPFFVLSAEGKPGMGPRQCTREFKIDPIRRKVRELLGIPKGRRVPRGVWIEQWIGISSDEIVRMKDARDKWTTNRWPLVDKRLSRADCRAWFARRYPGRALPRSACIGCPFHDDDHWRDMRDNDPASWADAVEIDSRIRTPGRGLRGRQFMHGSLLPLAQAVAAAKPKAQSAFSFMTEGFAQECDGMCGN